MGTVSNVIVTRGSVERGSPKSAGALLPLVYDELRRVAAATLAGQPPGQTLQPTALVHEAYLRLLGGGEHAWNGRRHFFAAATEAMRHILVDRARRKSAVRHGSGHAALSLDSVEIAADAADAEIVRVHEALDRLARHDAAAAELVKLRFFGGFTFAQAADLSGVSERTAKRTWVYARAWLFEEMQRSG